MEILVHASTTLDHFTPPPPGGVRLCGFETCLDFAEEKPRVKLIPGSSEQRGTDIREALRGGMPFCRQAILLLSLCLSMFVGPPQQDATTNLLCHEGGM